MENYNISVIIPIFNLTSYRVRNFLFVLDELLRTNVNDIIVVEQICTEYEESTALAHIRNNKKFRYIKHITDNTEIEKTKLINIGVSHSTSKFISMIDADIFFNYDNAFKQVEDSDLAIQPFTHFVKLNQENSANFIKKPQVDINASPDEKICCYSAGAFIMSREFYDHIGGMDEGYTGWGWEDREFQDRVKNNTDIKVLDMVGCHLYHDPSKCTNSSNNYIKYYNSLKENIDTALIYVTYSLGEERLKATLNALAHLKLQSLPIHMIWVELLFADEPSPVSNIIESNDLNIQHIIVRGSDLNANLFQKEALQNIAVKELDDKYKYLIFADSDVYTLDGDWFLKIRNKLTCYDNIVVQGGEQVIFLDESRNSSQQTIDTMWAAYKNGFQNASFNPGICIATTKSFWEKINGFNPYGVMFYGDTLFCIEIFKNKIPEYYKKISKSKFIGNIIRDIPIDVHMDGTNHTIIHDYHGQVQSFGILYKFLTNLDIELTEYIGIDNNGLLYWIKDLPIFSYIYARSRSIKSENDLFKMLISSNIDLYK